VTIGCALLSARFIFSIFGHEIFPFNT
jgi:hypothetical protein